MLKKMGTHLSLIKRKIVNKFTLTCDCCGKEATIEKGLDEEFKGMEKTRIKQQDLRKAPWLDRQNAPYEFKMMGIYETILPNNWFTLSDGRTICCEECLIKLMDEDKDKVINDYRKKQLDKLRK